MKYSPIFLAVLFLFGCSSQKPAKQIKTYQITSKCNSEEHKIVKEILADEVSKAYKKELSEKTTIEFLFFLSYENRGDRRDDIIEKNTRNRLLKLSNPYSLECYSEREVYIFIGESFSSRDTWYNCDTATDKMAISKCKGEK